MGFSVLVGIDAVNVMAAYQAYSEEKLIRNGCRT
jgi:hypothetical protein